MKACSVSWSRIRYLIRMTGHRQPALIVNDAQRDYDTTRVLPEVLTCATAAPTARRTLKRPT